MTTILAMAGLMVLLGVVGFVVYFLTRYIPIVSNLFMDVTVKTRAEEDAEVSGEEVRFRAQDGVELRGTLTEGDAGSPVVVFCHEFSSTRHAASRYARFLQEAGFRIFTFDFRGHGESEQPAGYVSRLWTTRREVWDVKGALQYLGGREDMKGAAVGLFGVSRGGTVALCAASECAEVRAVVTDGAYSTFQTLDDYVHKWVPIFVKARWMYAYSPAWMYHSVDWLALKFSEVRMCTRIVSVERCLRKLEVPALQVHGERDNYLNLDQARYLAGLNERQVQLWVVSGANHNEAVELVPQEYRFRLTEFFTRHLGGKRAHAVREEQPAGAGVTPLS